MKNVLFITYYWPPAGGVSVNRIFNFYKYLPEYGWNPIILTIDQGQFPFIDHSLMEQVRRDTIVKKSANHSPMKWLSGKVKEKEFVPYGFTDTSTLTIQKKILRSIKYNFIPDTRIFWYPSAIQEAHKLIQEHDIEFLFSSSPPQTNHVIASRLASRHSLPWVADLRDPWSDVFWLKKDNIRFPLVSRADQALERKTLQRADALVTVSPTWQEAFKNRIEKETHIIYNGYNEEVFERVKVFLKETDTSEKKLHEKNRFKILYTGSMSYQQRPHLFFKVLTNLRLRNPEVFQKIHVEFIGNYPSFLESMIRDSDMQEQVSITPFMPYQSAVREMMSADLLLIIGVEGENDGVIPSKIFDYLATQKPVLGFGLGKDTRELMNDRRDAIYATEDTLETAESFILEMIKRESTSGLHHEPLGIKANDMSNDLLRFSRRNQTQQLARIFDDVWNRRNS